MTPALSIATLKGMLASLAVALVAGIRTLMLSHA